MMPETATPPHALHGGNIHAFAQQWQCETTDITDFSANINPYQAVSLPLCSTVDYHAYADPDYTLLKQALYQRYPLLVGQDIEPFNGASAAIFALLRFLNPSHASLYAPLYLEYPRLLTQQACPITWVNRLDSLNTVHTEVPRGSVVIFVNPSTPDGQYYPLESLLEAWAARDCTVIIDESFLDFSGLPSAMAYLATYPKLYIIKSLTKFYGCAGVRVGFIAGQDLNDLRTHEPAWKLSSFDMYYIQQALKNQLFIQQTQQETKDYRQQLHTILANTGLFKTLYPSHCNFLLTQLAQISIEQLEQQLHAHKILVRSCHNFHFLDSSFVRFAVKSPQALATLQQAFTA